MIGQYRINPRSVTDAINLVLGEESEVVRSDVKLLRFLSCAWNWGQKTAKDIDFSDYVSNPSAVWIHVLDEGPVPNRYGIEWLKAVTLTTYALSHSMGMVSILHKTYSFNHDSKSDKCDCRVCKDERVKIFFDDDLELPKKGVSPPPEPPKFGAGGWPMYVVDEKTGHRELIHKCLVTSCENGQCRAQGSQFCYVHTFYPEDTPSDMMLWSKRDRQSYLMGRIMKELKCLRKE